MAAVRRGTRLSWATIHRLKAPRAATTTTWQAMQDERGCLQSEPTVIKRLWEGYVRKLFSFNNGLSDEHWQNQAPALEPQGTAAEPPVDAAPNVTSITWPLCLQALRKLGNNKAPGPDGIPGEVLKLLLIAEPRCSEQPTTPMGRVLWFTYQSTWTSCIIPAQWRESIIVFLQKKNTDATVFTGYRGISLISAPAKVLCSMACLCLENWLERNQVICSEQYGFSSQEECIAAAIALYEACIRRDNAGQPTILLYIDLKQAFDHVDHRGLNIKLQRINCPTDLRSFINALYACSTVRIKFADGSLGSVIRLLIGVRQGCPMSPAVYKLDINDLPAFIKAQVEDAGVTVPGHDNKWVIALFADDTVEMLDTTAKTLLTCTATVTWLQRNGGAANAPKSAIVVSTSNESSRAEITTEIQAEARHLMFDNIPIPIATQYTYLGLVITDNLSLLAMANDRILKGTNCLKAYRPILCNTSIPLSARVDIVVCCIQAMVTYGIALWGMSKDAVAGAQKVIDNALRTVIGGNSNTKSASIITIRRECGVRSLESCAKAQALTLLARGRNTQRKSWFAKFTQEDPPHVCARSWFSYVRQVSNEVGEAVTNLKDSGEIAKTLDKQVQAKCKAAGWLRFAASKMAKQRIVARGYVWPAALGFGLQILTRLRVGAQHLGNRLVHLPSNKGRPQQCWSCNAPGTKEDIGHLLSSCTRWSEQRRRYLNKSIRAAKALICTVRAELCDANIATLLLGGRVNGQPLPKWGWERKAYVTITACDVFDAATWEHQPTYLCVAKFLQMIWPRRRRLVFAISI
jgi:hypothetical protein